jgi:lipopolysaccharide transport system ATP-binding protein
MSTTISIESLSKVYRVHQGADGQGMQYHTLRDDLASLAAVPWRRMRRVFAHGCRQAAPQRDHDFWALRDVSFSVRNGEVVGIIGRNGAGKSTLLKILSRITRPTTGRVAIRGRVGSLLEVGTGFHPELTGRENIFMNGSILGMSRREIVHKFDEMVDFSGVERFLDTPVKRFSSGMAVRLAFAVAAFLETEVLFVDEVLSVGDAAFQRRCLNKMNEAARSGRTVLFVSHDMAAVQSFCSRCLLLESGRVVEDGSAGDVVAAYWHRIADVSQAPPAARTDRQGTGQARIVECELLDGSGQPVTGFPAGGSAQVRVTITHREAISLPRVVLMVSNSLGQKLFTVRSFAAGWQEPIFPPSSTMTCSIPALMLVPGTYFLSVLVRNQNEILDFLDPLRSFDLLPADVFGSGHCPDASTGVMLVESRWKAVTGTCAPKTQTAGCQPGSPGTATRPNLFVIGASKCGTTSLHEYLAMHPDVVMSTFKEPGYFVDEFHREPCVRPAADSGVDALDLYRNLFPGAEQKRYAGESTTNYAALPRFQGVAERICRFNPDARLIYVVRDPVERAISHYWYWAMTCEETLGDPLRAIQENPAYCDVSDYALQLREYLRFFPRDQIHIMTAEDLRDDTARSMAQLFEWLGLEIPTRHASERYSQQSNVTPDIFLQRRTHLPWRIRASPVFRQLRVLIPRSVRKASWGFISGPSLGTRRVVRSEVNLAATIAFLRERLFEKAREFEELCGMQFSQWRTVWESEAGGGEASPALHFGPSSVTVPST